MTARWACRSRPGWPSRQAWRPVSPSDTCPALFQDTLSLAVQMAGVLEAEAWGASSLWGLASARLGLVTATSTAALSSVSCFWFPLYYFLVYEKGHTVPAATHLRVPCFWSRLK